MKLSGKIGPKIKDSRSKKQQLKTEFSKKKKAHPKNQPSPAQLKNLLNKL
jgi:hypothetical protein